MLAKLPEANHHASKLRYKVLSILKINSASLPHKHKHGAFINTILPNTLEIPKKKHDMFRDSHKFQKQTRESGLFLRPGSSHRDSKGSGPGHGRVAKLADLVAGFRE